MTNDDKDPIVVSFGDACLRQEDLQTLEPNEWLNDGVIWTFAELLAARSKDSKSSQSQPTSNDQAKQDAKHSTPSLLWQPAVVELMCSVTADLGAEEARDLLPPAGPLVVLPVSDRYSTEGLGIGSHWSCILAVEQAFKGPGSGWFGFHLDSMRPCNDDAAKTVWSAFLHTRGIKSSAVKRSLFEVEEVSAQANAHDCGLYMLLLSDLIISQHLDPIIFRPTSMAAALSNAGKTPPALSSLASDLTPAKAAQLRIDLHDFFSKWAQRQQLAEVPLRMTLWKEVRENVGDYRSP
ncbi:Sentrin-specific cysteine protease (Ulp1 family) [Ceraceosorus bombacis]|uniref:Sentrin-specific cysteine protease (Ulp1 family) n=1 Tax=Ceraceosorus bombacis TaxID=401625 RepID=A0A0P1BDV2_9BASI|nr:Sentrin-specific cysteine protease (Ulp1 family) [Ceraceosorus bombacis]